METTSAQHIAWAGILRGRFKVSEKKPTSEGIQAARDAARKLAELEQTEGWDLLVELLGFMERGLLRGVEPPEIPFREQYAQNMGIREGLIRARQLPEVMRGIAARADDAMRREVRTREERSRAGGAYGSGSGTGSG